MKKILIIGSADLASATAMRLFRAGFPVCLLDDTRGMDIHGFRNFNLTPVLGEKNIAGISALSEAGFMQRYTIPDKFSTFDFITEAWANRVIPFLFPQALTQKLFGLMDYLIICNGRFNDVLSRFSLPEIIAPDNVALPFKGYRIYAGGAHLGRVDYPFLETIPVSKLKKMSTDILAGDDGVFYSFKTPGEAVQEGETLGNINEHKVIAPLSGYLEGVVRSGAFVGKKQQIASVHPQKMSLEIPFEFYAVAGGILEVILYDVTLNKI